VDRSLANKLSRALGLLRLSERVKAPTHFANSQVLLYGLPKALRVPFIIVIYVVGFRLGLLGLLGPLLRAGEKGLMVERSFGVTSLMTT